MGFTLTTVITICSKFGAIILLTAVIICALRIHRLKKQHATALGPNLPEMEVTSPHKTNEPQELWTEEPSGVELQGKGAVHASELEWERPVGFHGDTLL